jgi:hypothetical protein
MVPGGGPPRPACSRGALGRRPSAAGCRRSRVNSLTSATSSGRTPTRLKTSGGPNPLSARRHVERHFGRRRGLEVAPQAFQLRILAEAKSIAKAALRAYAQNRVTVLERKIGDV